MRIAILGAGAIGPASAALAVSRGHDAVLWSPSGAGTRGLDGALHAEGVLEGAFPVAVATTLDDAFAGADAALLAVPTYALPALLPRIAAAPAAAAEPGPGAEAWSESRVAALRAEGHAVFVNATAAWCITCQVNERVALRSEAVRAAFAARSVAYLKADWTGGDPAIGALLRAHGRDGVPLYLLYPAGGGAPEVLPQILTEGIVLRALGG